MTNTKRATYTHRVIPYGQGYIEHALYLVRGFPLTPLSKEKLMKKRTKKIEIRVSETEYEQLLERKTKTRLAEWIRETCLESKLNKKAKPIPKIDPTLLVALSKIGSNLNQIARHLNTDKILSAQEKVKALLELTSIEQSLGELVGNADKVF